MPASASAGARGNFPIGVIGEKADLTYRYDYLGAGAGDARRALGGKHDSPKRCKTPSGR